MPPRRIVARPGCCASLAGGGAARMAATGKTTSGQAAEHAEAGKAYYAALFPDVGVGYFAALWHTVTVGHLVAGNLEQIARRHGVGIGDLHVLGFLGFQEDQSLRPTDLARALFLTNAAITRRLNHLAARGFVASGPAGKDRRSTWISLTPAGRAVVEAALKDIGQNSN